MARPITFLSDYGLDDEFVGVCHAVIAGIAPEARVIDIAHGIPRYDVRKGAAVLASALPFAPPGVHLAVVDPGVGSVRRAVAAVAVQQARFFVGPDNGLLAPALARFGGARLAVEISNSPARLEPVSATFHGRDVFAPVAAVLAAGNPLEKLGEQIDPASLVELPRLEPVIDEDGVRAVVLDSDRFGNAALELTVDEAERAGLRPGGRIRVEAGGTLTAAAFVRTFAEVGPDELLVYVDSTGSVTLAANLGSAAERLGLSPGDEVVLRPR